MTLKKLTFLSLFLAPIALVAAANPAHEHAIPVITLPMKIPAFGIITAQIQDSQTRIDAMRQSLEEHNRVLFLSATPNTPTEQLPSVGVCAKIFSLRAGWGYLEVTAFAAGQANIIEFVGKNGLIHAVVEQPDQQLEEGNYPFEQGNANKPSKEQSPRQKIEKLPIPDEDKKELLKQADLLEKTPPQSPEYSMIERYIDLVLALPWDIQTTDNLDIKHIKEILDRDHSGLETIKNDILDFISVRQLNPNGNGKILCLVGPPGTGKTSICKSIAESMGRKYQRVALGALHDEAEIRGHRRTYIGALPGRIIQAVKKAQSKNPLMVLDEIDKVGQSHRGDPTAALLELLDPEQNNTFHDNYLAVPFDLSKVLFIATANSLDTIPGPLLDRMEIIELSGYTVDEKMHIAQKHIVAKAIKATGLQSNDVTIEPDALERVIVEYTREAGVRQLERVIKKLCEKAARAKVENKQKTTFTAHNLEEFLKAPKFPIDLDGHEHRIGVAHGLAWTPAGGVTMDIEAVLMPGKGKIILTGKLGEVMQESAQAALSYAKAHAQEFGIDPILFNERDIHIHAPAGAVPKDGPSAGVTILTAVISAFTNQPVNGNYAMTGEINLHGDVMPIGGVKEKILAAKQNNYKNVIVPAKNKNKVTALDSNVLKGVNIIYAKHANDVLKHVFTIKDGGSGYVWPFLRTVLNGISN